MRELQLQKLRTLVVSANSAVASKFLNRSLKGNEQAQHKGSSQLKSKGVLLVKEFERLECLGLQSSP